MKSMAFAAIVAALTLAAMALTIEAASATEIVQIKGKYSKSKLDGICSAEGGEPYQTQSGGGYGCHKGGNTVECDPKGNCTGYIGLVAQPGKPATGQMGSPRAVLGMDNTLQPATGATGKLPAAGQLPTMEAVPTP